MAKLGSHKRPAVVRVQSMEHAQEIMSICHENDWQVIVGIEPDEAENIDDVEALLNPQRPCTSAHLKVGRNEICHCGSGKKYKKCCLSPGTQSPKNNLRSFKNKEPSTKVLVTTLTNEFFQPMRLYYRVHNKTKLIARFKKLKCMEYYEMSDEWTILYADEAANITLAIPPEKVPPEAQPLIIATIHMPDEQSMVVDVRSIERASRILEFIDRHVPRRVAEATDAAIYNQLITAETPESAMRTDYSEIFSERNIISIDPEKTLLEMEELAEQYVDKQEALAIARQKIMDHAKKHLPVVEKFPLFFYDEKDGIKHFEMTCKMRQAIAMEHFKGNTRFTFFDLVQKMFPQEQLLPG